MAKRYRLKKKALSSIMTFVIIFTLIISGPANAVSVTIDPISNVAVGGTTTISGSIDIESGEVIPVDGIKITIGNGSCNIAVDGTLSGNVSGLCDKLTSPNINTSNSGSTGSATWGYGYGTKNDGTSFSTQNMTYSGYGYGYAADELEEVTYSVVYTPGSADVGDQTVIVDVITGSTEYPRSETSQTFTVSAPSSSSSSSSGNTIVVTLPPANGDDGEPLNFTLEKRDQVEFKYDSADHRVTVDRVGRDVVDITIASTPTEFRLYEGDSVEKDLDDDGDMDLRVTVNDIVAYRSVVLEIQELGTPPVLTYDEDPVIKAPVEETEDATGDTTTSEGDEPAVEPTPVEEEAGSLMWIVYVLIGIAVIAAAVVVVKKRK